MPTKPSVDWDVDQLEFTNVAGVFQGSHVEKQFSSFL